MKIVTFERAKRMCDVESKTDKARFERLTGLRALPVEGSGLRQRPLYLLEEVESFAAKIRVTKEKTTNGGSLRGRKSYSEISNEVRNLREAVEEAAPHEDVRCLAVAIAKLFRMLGENIDYPLREYIRNSGGEAFLGEVEGDTHAAQERASAVQRAREAREREEFLRG